MLEFFSRYRTRSANDAVVSGLNLEVVSLPDLLMLYGEAKVRV